MSDNTPPLTLPLTDAQLADIRANLARGPIIVFGWRSVDALVRALDTATRDAANWQEIAEELQGDITLALQAAATVSAAANADRARLVARVDQLEYHARAVVTAQRAHYGSYVWSERLDRLQAVLDDTTTTTTREGA